MKPNSERSLLFTLFGYTLPGRFFIAKFILDLLFIFIHPTKLNDYSIEGKIDAMGVKQVNTSLKYLMSNCRDFIEESLLQSNGRKIGITIDQMPKCHCELAGDGVGYSWVCAKKEFRRKPIRLKKSKELFKATVRECLSRDVVTDERVRRFSKRAREYICACHVLHEQMIQEYKTDDGKLLPCL
jgi:hypothetical protein